jgi:hypothetical protein
MGNNLEKAYPLDDVVMTRQTGLEHARLKVDLRLGVQLGEAL